MNLIRTRLTPGAAYLMLTGTMFCLALNHVIGRGIHETAPPVGLSFWRWTTAGALMLPLVWRSLPSKWPIYRRSWKLFLVLGLLMVGGTTLFLVTVQFTTAINISLVNALQPATTVMLSWLTLRQRLRWLQAVGVVLGLIGVVTMVSQGSWQALAELDFNPGDLLAVVGVTGLSAYAIGLRWLPEGLNPVEVLFGIIVVGCLLILPIHIAETLLWKPVPVTTASVGAILAMGVVGSFVGNLTWNMGNQALGPNRASIFINLIPVFGTLMAVTFLGEQIRLYHLAGFAMICAAVWCVLARPDAQPTEESQIAGG